jgi:hypothetical protein
MKFINPRDRFDGSIYSIKEGLCEFWLDLPVSHSLYITSGSLSQMIASQTAHCRQGVTAVGWASLLLSEATNYPPIPSAWRYVSY